MANLFWKLLGGYAIYKLFFDNSHDDDNDCKCTASHNHHRDYDIDDDLDDFMHNNSYSPDYTDHISSQNYFDDLDNDIYHSDNHLPYDDYDDDLW